MVIHSNLSLGLALLSLSALASTNLSFVLGDPLYSRHRLHNNLLHTTTTIPASNRKRPWGQQQDTTRMMTRREIPYISWKDAVRDKRARIYTMKKQNRQQPNTYSVTTRIVASTVVVFALQTIRPGLTQAGLKISDRILRGEQLYRLITPVFLHGGIFHLFFNMSSLKGTGTEVETLFGPGRYLGTYLAAGVAGNLLSSMQSPNPALGASGAVFGIFGAYFTYLMRNEWLLGSAGRSTTSSVTQTMLFNLLYGAMNPQIDNWAHLGGLLGGAVVAYYTGPRLYLCQDTPNEESVLIDRPFIRAPEYLEAAGSKCAKAIDRIGQTLSGLPGLRSGNHPWQNPGPRRNEYSPKGSVKPQSGGLDNSN